MHVLLLKKTLTCKELQGYVTALGNQQFHHRLQLDLLLVIKSLMDRSITTSD